MVDAEVGGDRADFPVLAEIETADSACCSGVIIGLLPRGAGSRHSSSTTQRLVRPQTRSTACRGRRRHGRINGRECRADAGAGEV